MPVATVQPRPPCSIEHPTAPANPRRSVRRGDAEPSPARLDAAVYHRRRTVAVVLAIAIVWVVLGAGSALVQRVTGSPGLPAAGADIEDVDYVVQPGDTVWGIAEQLSPEGADVRLMVDAVRDSVGGVTLTVGQRITVPQAAS